jgi:hypothetical protein
MCRLSPALGLVLLALLAPSGPSRAQEMEFGPTDVPTVFFISKSDDGSRVDYGLRLDEVCAPVGDEPVFPYWRELDEKPVKTHDLKWIEHFAYGISDQRVERKGAGFQVTMRLKRIDRDLVIDVSRAGGRCRTTVRTRIGNLPAAELSHAHVTLGERRIVSLLGRDPATGKPVEEQL